MMRYIVASKPKKRCDGQTKLSILYELFIRVLSFSKATVDELTHSLMTQPHDSFSHAHTAQRGPGYLQYFVSQTGHGVESGSASLCSFF